MTRRVQHDLFVHQLARAELDTPAWMHRELGRLIGLPDTAPLPPIFSKETEAELRAILALDDVPHRKAVAILRRGRDQCEAAAEMLMTMFKVHGMFQDMAFTRDQLETLPEGYRKEIIAQRRRKRLRLVDTHA